MSNSKYVKSEIRDHIGIVTFTRPPKNYFNVQLISELLAALTANDECNDCRVNVIFSEGDIFCAGGDFGRGEHGSDAHIELAANLYAQGMKLFRIKKPIIVAVQGAAVGGGLGLALVADFRVSCDTARFSANFTRLGMHPGFGTSYTLPRVVGIQNAQMLFLTGKRISGKEAHRIGLVDLLVEKSQLREATLELAQEIAMSAPNAVQDTRASMRLGMADEIDVANKRELALQKDHMRTEDFTEGLIATQERRQPKFKGK